MNINAYQKEAMTLLNPDIPKEDVLLGTPSYQQKLVEGMYEGIARYCGR